MIHSEELETEISAGSAPGMRYVKGSQAEEWETVKVAVWKQMQVAGSDRQCIFEVCFQESRAQVVMQL